MKVQFAWLPLALALTAVAQPVSAADWGVPNGRVIDGGIKEFGSGAAVPVPVPMPIPEYKANWYFRLDAGLGIIDDADVSEEGFVYGKGSLPEGELATRGSQPAWFSQDFNTFLTLGGGVGYYVGRGFRVDATIEKLSSGDAVMAGSDEYDTHANNAGTYGVVDANLDGIADKRTRVSVFDKTSIHRTAWMLNGYYDFANSGRFTPYVGAGLGFTWDVLSRTHHNQIDTCNNDNAPGPGSPTDCQAGRYTNSATFDSSPTRVDQISFAASMMAGVSIDLRESTKLDLGYRYMYLGGFDVPLKVCCETSTIKVGSQDLHEFHAGLRFDID